MDKSNLKVGSWYRCTDHFFRYDSTDGANLLGKMLWLKTSYPSLRNWLITDARVLDELVGSESAEIESALRLIKERQ